MIEISRRLQHIAGLVTKGNRVADIGSDHALLPVYLIQNEIAPFCIAGEVNKGPWESALKQVQKAGLTEKIDVRHGDGLSVIEPGEVDTICIAGMGGNLITRILANGKEKLKGVSELVLQPNVGEQVLRKWLKEENWELIEELIIEEDGIIYEILRAIPGNGMKPYENKERKEEELLELGPILWEKAPPLLWEKRHKELSKLQKIVQQLEKSHSPEIESKKQEFSKRIAWIEEVLGCLQARNRSCNS
jgi:tRNA (adenine22-N1)-methyltransferase